MRFNASSLVRRIILWCGAFAVSISAFGFEHDAHSAKNWYDEVSKRYAIWSADAKIFNIVNHKGGTVTRTDVTGINGAIEDFLCGFSFHAEPKAGYSFDKWVIGGRYSNLDSTEDNPGNYDLVENEDKGDLTFIEYYYMNPRPPTFDGYCSIQYFTLTPVFTNNFVTVTLTTETGEFEAGVKSVETKVKFDEPYPFDSFPAPVRLGYELTGWKQGDALLKADALVDNAESHELKAVMEKKRYYVTYDRNFSGSPDAYGPYEVKYTDAYPMPAATPSRAGYEFKGWWMDQASEEDEDEQIVNGKEFEICENQTLYAHWSAKSYKVTLNAGEGTIDSSEKTVTFDSEYGALPSPTPPAEHDFVGWQYEGKFIAETDLVKVAKNHALTAVYKAKIHYVVRFDANLARAIGAMDDIAAVYDSAVTLPMNAFYHADYTFVAWSLDKEVAEPLPEPLMNLASEEGEVVTFYAIWKKKAKDTLNEAVDADNVVVSGSDFTVTDESAEKGATSASARINKVNKNTVSLACSFKGKGIFSFAYRMSFDERDRGSLSASCNGNELTTDENWRTYSAVLGEDNKSTTITIVMGTTLAGTNKWPKDDALIYLDDIRFLPLNEEELAAYEEGEEAWRRYLVTGKKDDATELKAKIALGEDGEPLVTWEPDLGASREYTVEGKEKLEDGAWHKAKANDHFFRVSVELK